MGIFSGRKGTKAEGKEEACSCGSCGNIQSNVDYENDAAVTNSAIQQQGEAASIKILGSGCKNCRALLQNTKEAVSASKINADVEYITDMQEVAKYGVMSMPALVVNEQVVSMGKVLKSADIQKLLKKIGIA